MDYRHLFGPPAENESEAAQRLVCEGDLEELENNPILRIVDFVEWIAQKCIQMWFDGAKTLGGTIRIWEENTTITGASMGGEIGVLQEPFQPKRVDNEDGSYHFVFQTYGVTEKCFGRRDGECLLERLEHDAVIPQDELDVASGLLPPSETPW